MNQIRLKILRPRLFLARRFAQHASPLTTIIYMHPSDEELDAGIKDLPC